MSKDCEAEGYDAALSGWSETANPYDPEKEEAAYCAWNDGWLRFHDERNGDDE